ncbi:hypothetical protein MMC08_002028 [Hypocenomyce scalaris]|nr:hypothetical protein [Hypocenomyce scalaris]
MRAGITECQIISWSVKPGDRVEQFDKICEVQSDKASVEITSRFDGIIKALHYDTEDMAIVGQPLLDIDIEGDDIAEDAELLAEPAEPKQKGGQLEEAAEIIKDEIQSIAGPTEPQILEEYDGKLRKPSSQLPTSPPDPQPSGKQAPLVTPALRHMLKKHNINVEDIRGTGKDGRVLKEDVQHYMSAMSAPPSSAGITSTGTAGTITSSTPTSVPHPSAEDHFVPMTPTEHQMFKVMTRSLSIPHFLYTHSVDVTPLNRLRRRINTVPISTMLHPGDPGPRLTTLPFILKALSCAFQQYPKLNAHLDVDSDAKKPRLVLKGGHHFGIAIDTSQGLLVPVVRNVQSRSVVELAAEIVRLSALAKEGRLTPEDFKGATFTVSNVGSIGGGVVSPVIVAPMIGILGVGRTEGVPVFGEDMRVVRMEKVVLSWSADHRAVDGATVARCAEAVARWLENVDVLGVALK